MKSVFAEAELLCGDRRGVQEDQSILNVEIVELETNVRVAGGGPLRGGGGGGGRREVAGWGKGGAEAWVPIFVGARGLGCRGTHPKGSGAAYGRGRLAY